MKKGVFDCDCGTSPLRNYAIIFEIGQTCKIVFRYNPIDIYQIQTVHPKKFSNREQLKQIVKRRRSKLIDVVEIALDSFKNDQVHILIDRVDRVVNQAQKGMQLMKKA